MYQFKKHRFLIYLNIFQLSGSNFYIHGGVTTKDSKHPSDKLYCFNSGSWKELSFPGCPALSHHASVSLDNKYIVLIGGWNGKVRTSNIYVFDTEKSVWTIPQVTGFPEGGGLSSHTALLLDNGSILVLGREGSLRMQRRHGNGYILKGSVESGKFHYSEFTHATASRSGHTQNIIGNKMYIVGGRDNNLIEVHQGFKSPFSCDSVITRKLSEITNKMTSLSKLPGGRKHHIAVSGPGLLFIYGGETFDGRSREPVGEMYIITFKPEMTFYKVGVSDIGRAGAVCVVHGDEILLHGGFGGKNNVYGDTYNLNFL